MSGALRKAFRSQARACARLDSPFMERLLTLLAERWPEQTAIAQKLNGFEGDIGPAGASLPLRLAGGLHALRLQGRAGLAAVYPPNAPDDEALWSVVEAALRNESVFLCDWVENAPQTNEVRRSAALIAAAHLIAARHPLPLRVSELGASGGLNLMFDRFALQTEAGRLAPADPALMLEPDWRGPMPTPARVNIVERRGADLNPLDPENPEDALRLLAYLWPDQDNRIERTRAAMSVRAAQVDRSDAIAWLAPRLSHQSGRLHLIYHTIAWQYFPATVQAEGTRLIEDAGALATDDTPLAWLRMEADGAANGAALSLRLWPDDITVELARVDFHGRWIEWIGPRHL